MHIIIGKYYILCEPYVRLRFKLRGWRVSGNTNWFDSHLNTIELLRNQKQFNSNADYIVNTFTYVDIFSMSNVTSDRDFDIELKNWLHFGVG